MADRTMAMKNTFKFHIFVASSVCWEGTEEHTHTNNEMNFLAAQLPLSELTECGRCQAARLVCDSRRWGAAPMRPISLRLRAIFENETPPTFFFPSFFIPFKHIILNIKGSCWHLEN